MLKIRIPLPALCVTNPFPSYHLPGNCVSDFLRIVLLFFLYYVYKSVGEELIALQC